jgi:hypothetical protein
MTSCQQYRRVHGREYDSTLQVAGRYVASAFSKFGTRNPQIPRSSRAVDRDIAKHRPTRICEGGFV